MKRIKVLGITGGVGAGKSTVLSYLQRAFGANVLQLDEAAHLLMQPQGECYEAIVEAFGRDVLAADGRIDRAVLYRKTFGDKSRLALLNGIVHPRVKQYARAWIAGERAKGEAPFLVLEAALLLEEHYDTICDEIWYIAVEEAVRAARLQAARGYSQEKIAQILANQKTDAQFRAGCHYVIDNSSDDLKKTYEQLDKGLREHEFV